MPEKESSVFGLAATTPLRRGLPILSILIFLLALWTYNQALLLQQPLLDSTRLLVAPSDNNALLLQKCSALRDRPNPFALDALTKKRTTSDRYEPGPQNMSYLITNATIFTGVKDDDGVLEILYSADLLMTNGLVRAVGTDVPRDLALLAADVDPRKLTIIKANGSWVTPGLVDVNSYLGVFSSPGLGGGFELDSQRNRPVSPWLRSIDGLHTRDNAFELTMAAGVTSAQVLPGTLNSIGGEAFVVKLRRTSEGSALSMVIDPPLDLGRNRGRSQEEAAHWRHLIQSCGDKTRRYGNRMDTMWSLRAAYYQAKRAMNAQDNFCAQVEAGREWESELPSTDGFQWDILVDVLRGKVKVTSDCSEALDLDNMIRLSNEFDFPIAIFLHGSEAYLVPSLLNASFGGAPAIALSSSNHRHTRESYRGSEFASAVLSSNNFSVIMTTDSPFVNSRQLIDEARKAYHFGLPENLAIASVTSAPADALGMGYRIGYLKEGYDADVVMWDSHPLRLGATPTHVWIDGMKQIPLTKNSGRSTYGTSGVASRHDNSNSDPSVLSAPGQPSYKRERQDTLDWDGLPPLKGIIQAERVVFRNVKEIWTRKRDQIVESFVAEGNEFGVAIVEKGKITCSGAEEECLLGGDERRVDIDLRGGSIVPGLMTFGSALGVEEIESESSTTDGRLFNALAADVPSIFKDVGGMVRAFDALMFETRHARRVLLFYSPKAVIFNTIDRMAYRFGGITAATSSLSRPHYLNMNDDSLVWGLSATFSTAAAHALEPGAIIQTDVALHVRITRPRFDVPVRVATSVSSQVAALRRLLFGWEDIDSDTGRWFRKAAEGVVPLVVEVHSADIMASLIMLRAEVDAKIGGQMRMVFVGAKEAWLLAKELSDAKVGVILTSLKPVADTWDERRILPGPPLTEETALKILVEHGVVVGIGIDQPQFAAETRFQLSQAYDSAPSLTPREVYSLASINLERLLGVKAVEPETADLVAFEGGSAFNLSSKVAAVISASKGQVDIL
ncbi:hypothetical protein D9757_002646 [Collybiopsis confluens]|uniref:Amidohydrolase-related domain-containing protein n=1 Tax=Collybiopsis confluens TaxID=2823264 RepID=A0A8H5HW36_9AGAR|nr:hypothetical protein D9757_002646 [Collybiopsis confluens]